MKNNLKEKIFAYGLFWSWNLLYLILFITMEYNMGIVYTILMDAISGAPLDFIFSALLIYFIPIGSIVLGATLFRKQPQKLVRLFYGVEVPLTLLSLLRIGLIRELNPGTMHLSLLLVIGMLSFFVGLFIEGEPKKKRNATIHLLLNSTLLFIGTYAALLLLFYIPIAGGGIYHLFKEGFFSLIRHIEFIHLIIFLFVLFSMTLFVGLPFALIILYFKSFRSSFKSYASQFGIRQAGMIVATFFVTNLFLFYWLNWNQPQEGVLEKLQSAKWSKDEIAEFSEDKDHIKEGLLNAYLASYRYLCAEENNQNVASMYVSVFSGERTNYAFIQSCNNFVLKPFLYSGKDIWMDHNDADKLYQQLFDEPIQKAERDAIRNALNATYERDQAEAGLLNIGEEKVFVTDQKLTVTEHDDIAEIELYECYQNQTFEQQEILYYFSLPDHAAITGLWLSDDNTEKKYKFRVSPRGAAQQVYKNEVQRRVDPSLLEQVGPGQYRLRAFPVLPKTIIYENNDYRRRSAKTVKEGAKLHLWLRYSVMKDEKNRWVLPQASQRRNVYCNSSTKGMVGDEDMKKDGDDEWLPQFIKSKNESSRKAYTCDVTDSVTVSVSPWILNKTETVSVAKSIALVLDLSYSMNNVRDALQETWKWLQEKNIKGDIYLTGMDPQKVTNIDIDKITFFGAGTPLGILHQFDSLRAGKKYDMAILFTDQGSYETEEGELSSLTLPFSLYILHLGDKVPYAYQDNVMETIQKSGGKSLKNIKDVFEDIYLKDKFSKDSSFMAYENGWLWNLNSPRGRSSEAMRTLAARQYINKVIGQTQNTNLSLLDKVHYLAMTNNIVTPYSSMIVLVDQRQKDELDKAELDKERFKRETETGKEVLSKPNSFGFNEVKGTPEPEEWILILIAGSLLTYFYLKKKIEAVKFK